MRRGYVEVPLPELEDGDVVYDATLYLNQETYYIQGNGTSAESAVYIYPVRSSEVNTTSGGYHYPTFSASHAEHEETPLDSCRILGTTQDASVGYHVTEAVKAWLTETSGIHGFCLVNGVEYDAEETQSHYVRYSSQNATEESRKPRFVVRYVSTRGLDGSQSYHSFFADQAGTGYLNDYTGALTWVLPLFAESGTRMPVGISLVYNSPAVADAASDRYYTRFCHKEMQSGTGWKFNVQEKLRIQNVEP